MTAAILANVATTGGGKVPLVNLHRNGISAVITRHFRRYLCAKPGCIKKNFPIYLLALSLGLDDQFF